MSSFPVSQSVWKDLYIDTLKTWRKRVCESTGARSDLRMNLRVALQLHARGPGMAMRTRLDLCLSTGCPE